MESPSSAVVPDVAATAAAAGDSSSTPSFTIILFYLYTRVESPRATLDWQQALCERLGLLGRIRIATEGINGTLAGSAESIQGYIADMDNCESPVHHGLFSGIAYKFSTSTTQPFPALGMFEVKELTATGTMAKSCKLLLDRGEHRLAKTSETATEEKAADSAAASTSTTTPTAQEIADSHLSPREWHAALQAFNPETDLLIDVRNAYETQIGLFEGAVDPKLRTFAQLPEYVTQNIDAIKSKKNIYMYCTGGIRCEKASLYMAHRSGAKVSQLAGGIHKYLDEFPDGGLFKGKNFVFDGRLAMASEDKTIVGKCVQCAVSCDDLSESVLCRVCKTFVILCPSCVKHYSEHKWRVYCAEHILLAAGKEVAPDAAAAAEPVDAAPEVAAAEDADDSTPAQAEEQWAVPANDPGCPEQLNSFLSRFTTAQLESQLEEIARILAFFKLKQRKAGSRSKNRKANLHLQKRRLEDYLRGRLRAEAEARGEAPPAEPTPEELARDQKRVAPLPPRDPNQLTSFVPLLNV